MTDGRHVYRSRNGTVRSSAPVWGFVLVLGLLLAAGVLLARAGWEPESIAGMLTAVGAAAAAAQVALSKLATLDERTQAIETRAENIERHANDGDGEITATIQAAVHKAIDLRLSGTAGPPAQRVDDGGGGGGGGRARGRFPV